jgi:lipopolysaccharide export system protein LptA
MTSARRIRLAIGMILPALAGGPASGADTPNFAAGAFEAKGFKVAEHYAPPHEAQIKSTLDGGKATPLAGVIMQSFSESNTLQLTIKAPECLYDSAGQTASSPGPLRVETPDGKFFIEGEGFLWQQTNSSLFISNRVHTLIKSEALQPDTTAASAKKPASDPEPTDIYSDLFSYDSGSGHGIYRKNVRVTNTNLNLVGGILTVEIPRAERQLQNVTAEQDVTIDYFVKGEGAFANNIEASGQRADFSTQTGLIKVSGGHPTWRANPREGRADELIIERTNQIFHANGHAWLQMPRQTFEGAGFLAPPGQAPKAGGSTNGLIEVQSDNYEFHTNWGVFRRKVQVTDRLDSEVRGRMSCDLMTLTFAGSNQLDRLVAQTAVRIEQDTNRFTGGRAVFTATNGILELTESPTWESGPRQGKGDVLRVNTQANELLALGHAFMRLPAEEFAADLVPSAPGQPTKPPRVGPGQFAEITSQQYTLRTNSASFRGTVHACHPRMEWVCDQLTVHSSAAQGKPESMLAETGVDFELENDDGQKVHGTADRAVYAFSVSQSQTNDLLTLYGNPATLVMTNATVHNDQIVYDRLNNSLATPGSHYRIEGIGPATAHTNLFAPPKRKSVK